MSDGEISDFLWKCVSCSGTRRRKAKVSSQNGSKSKNSSKKRKKKGCKCKDGTTRDQRIKKDKKKKKKKKKKVGEQLELGVLTQASVPGGPSVTAEPSGLDSSKNLQPDPEAPAWDSKLKKKVAFDLSPCGVRIKRPKLSSSTAPRLTKSILLKVEGDEGPTQDDDSQDVNSQDLFITQKTFRAPSPEASSGEIALGASAAAPLTLSPRGRPERRHLYRRASRPKRDAETPCTEKNVTQTTSVAWSLPKEVESSPVAKMSSWRSPEVKPSVVCTTKPKKHLNVLSRESKTSTSTQTENFFYAKLSSHHRFCRSAEAETPSPLDLSLPYRARATEDGLRSEMTPSLQSDSEPKSAETPTSGDDNEPHARAGAKLELAQVKAVQTRLNESFFFKTKGSRRSPRPESPLMKGALDRVVTTRRCR